MEKLVVTGAAGAVGRRVLSHWVEHSDGGFSSVLAVDRDSIWLVTDNNGYARPSLRSDLRPTLLKLARPDVK